MPIDGIAWSWHALGADDLPMLLPFVMAADPSGSEALHWPQAAVQWLAEQPGQRGLVGVQCLAEVTLALFFYRLTVNPHDLPRLAIHRLRWLELARPHRSLDALLVILTDTAQRLNCADVLIESKAATERNARAALDARAEALGFSAGPSGWHRPASN